ncbi:hypothetical protein D1AOALGA4SA_8288 [Olavius algarvensis Delta 1 endosymbiont]|nr:hypothetical protein D1AOALGA4SA_8288 [Olavius algarvensis Delta 1 endosymbiont]
MRIADLRYPACRESFVERSIQKIERAQRYHQSEIRNLKSAIERFRQSEIQNLISAIPIMY